MFVQMILTLKEYSKITCKNCLKILDHSITISDSSTINMFKHRKTIVCKKRKRSNFFS
jgi:hypothetical protein